MTCPFCLPDRNRVSPVRMASNVHRGETRFLHSCNSWNSCTLISGGVYVPTRSIPRSKR